jgi:hypothetical protein
VRIDPIEKEALVGFVSQDCLLEADFSFIVDGHTHFFPTLLRSFKLIDSTIELPTRKSE